MATATVIEAEPELAPEEDLVEASATIREAFERGSPEQRKALAQSLVAKIIVEGRSATQPTFWVPCAEVRRLCQGWCSRQESNLLPCGPEF